MEISLKDKGALLKELKMSPTPTEIMRLVCDVSKGVLTITAKSQILHDFFKLHSEGNQTHTNLYGPLWLPWQTLIELPRCTFKAERDNTPFPEDGDGQYFNGLWLASTKMAEGFEHTFAGICPTQTRESFTSCVESAVIHLFQTYIESGRDEFSLSVTRKLPDRKRHAQDAGLFAEEPF